MKIGIDGRLFGGQTGIGRYTTSLVTALVHLPEWKDDLILLGTNTKACPIDGVRFIGFESKHRIVWSNLHAPYCIRTQGIEVYHAVDNLGLPLFVPKGDARYVLTVHDLVPLRFPSSVSWKHRWYFRVALGHLVQLADVIIVDSEATKKDLLGVYPSLKPRIEVIYLGVDHKRFFPAAGWRRGDELRRKYQIRDEPYILFVGVLEPKKNLPSLLRAFGRLRGTWKDGRDYQLILAGPKGWMVEEILAVAEEMGFQGWVSIPGAIEDEDLPALYCGAEVFVFPSIYEGFGLPPLEAMACGVPVITSDTSSLPEVVGDAAITVAPADVEGLAAAMRRVLEDQTLREDMRQKGLKRVQSFSWEKTARQTLKVYEEVWAGGSR